MISYSLTLSFTLTLAGEPRVILAAVDDETTNSSSIWVIEKSIFTGNNAGIGGLGTVELFHPLLTHRLLLTYSRMH